MDIRIDSDDYDKLIKRAEKSEERYQHLVGEVEKLLGTSEVRIEHIASEFNKQVIYIKLDADAIDGKLKGYLEHRFKTQAHHY